jgi:hypothetical protein
MRVFLPFDQQGVVIDETVNDEDNFNFDLDERDYNNFENKQSKEAEQEYKEEKVVGTWSLKTCTT